MADQLNLVNPLATLERGFAIAHDSNKTVLRNSAQVAPGDKVDVRLSDGELHCEIVKVRQ